ncbi:MAG: hypothetical protein CL792_01135 [Chloroflexi bacterium]|nr:hypothetical protein [Chloroflexota bacterium]|tara:strand:- start:2545 stop:3288 length:744 start_codon:yes stop_codon:yes gene_type:complete
MNNDNSLYPKILITAAENVVGECWNDYSRCVSNSNGLPIRVDLGTDIETIQNFDGLLITAGIDIDPQIYGAEKSDYVTETNIKRDQFELALLEKARQLDVPVLAICRGHQLFNVGSGGSLLQHLENREPHRARRGKKNGSIDSGWHNVEVVKNTLLHKITNSTQIFTNSRHHQAVLSNNVGPGLIASALAEQNVIEALEDPSMTWGLSVQWHPERREMTDNADLKNASTTLFDAFIAAAKKYSLNSI